MRVKKVGAYSCARLFGLANLLIGFVLGLIIDILDATDTVWVESPFSLGASIALPLLYGGIGFLVGAIAGSLYNLIARWVGGIEVEFEDSPPKAEEPESISYSNR